MDSALTAAYAAKKYDLAFLHINYGQKTEKPTNAAWRSIARNAACAPRAPRRCDSR
ncbi:MAG: hypothetical protein J0M18_07740 [Ignavibacteria bacterium]|nr:hypothetical protein [Ignavibacteria bacterium]